MSKCNKRIKANLFPDGGGFDFSQIASMFGNSGGGQGGGNAFMSGANLTLLALNTATPDYKESSGNLYLSTLQALRKGSGNKIFDAVGLGVDMTLQIADMIDKSTHKEDKRSLEEIVGIYANGGNLFAGGGFNMGGAEDAMQTAAALYGNAKAQAAIKDTSSLKQNAWNNNVSAYTSNMSFDDVSNLYNNLRVMNHISANDLRPNSWGSDVINGISAGNQGAQAGFNVGGAAGAIIGGIAGTASSIWGSLTGRSKAKKEAESTNKLIDYKNNLNDRALKNNSEAVAQQQLNTAMKNIGAFGGSLETNGADFDNGFSFINEGGSHEQNPNDGVQIGVDQQGVPNLVEEGEVIWKSQDYVFSKRLKVPKSLIKENNLPTELEGKSFADAAKMLSKESEERPVDNVSQRGKDAMFSRLMTSQEKVREAKQARKLKNQYNSMSPDEQENLMMLSAVLDEMQNTQDLMLLTQEQQAAAQMMGAPQFACGGKMAYGGPKGNMFEGEGAFTNHYYNWGEAPTWADTPTYLWGNKYVEGITPEKLSEAMAMIKGFKPVVPGLEGYDINAAENQVKGTSLGNVNVDGKQKGKDAGTLEDVVVTGTNKSKRPLGVSVLTLPEPVYKKLDLSKVLNPDGTPVVTPITKKRNYTADALRSAALVPGLVGLTNPPTANTMIAGNTRDVTFSPSGVEMNLRPWDYNYVANQIIANNNGAARNIMNTAGTRGQAVAALLSNNYNLNKALGDAYATGYQYNNQNAEKMANFYNQRDLANAQGIMQAMAHNQSADAAYAQRAMAASEYNQNERDKVYATRMANLDNLFGNLSKIGEDLQNRGDAEFAARANREAITTSSKKCNGGKIKRRRKGLTR